MSSILSQHAHRLRSDSPRDEGEPRKGISIGWIIFILILALGGGGFWYYFFGQKPNVVLSVALATSEEGRANALWPLGNGEVLVGGAKELKLVNIRDRAVKWSATVPAAPTVDPAARAAVNARFVRVQQWAEELTRKRANLKTPEETKAFNEEAAKYQAELTAVRALSQQLTSAAPAAKPVVKPGAPAAAAAAQPSAPKVAAAPPVSKPAATPTKLNAAATPEMQLLEQRIKRRSDQIKKLDAEAKKKRAAAKTEIQLGAAKEVEARAAALSVEQKGDEDRLAELRGGAKPIVVVEQAPVVAANEEEEDEEGGLDWDAGGFGEAEPVAGLIGKSVWYVEGERMLAFDHGSGALLENMPLAGPVLHAWAASDGLYVIASAGPDARQITRVLPNARPVSLFVSAGKIQSPFGELENGGIQPTVQTLRTEFSRSLRADIRLVEKKVTARDAIKPGSDKELTSTIEGSAAGSTDELMAMMKVIENDGQRLAGITKQFTDDSTYEVTLKRPFDPTAPEWKGTVQGRVGFLSTESYDFMTAGQRLYAFNRANQKLWEAPLGAILPPGMIEDSAQTCLEVGERVYFADGAFLTAFEGATGKVLWRVPSIGIRKIQTDGEGNVYAHSYNLPTESITFSLDASFGGTKPVLMKINPGDGQIDWKVEEYEDFWVSGKDIYAIREARNPADIENAVFDPKSVQGPRVKLYKLRSGNGSPIWEWFQPRSPFGVYADSKTVGMMYFEELQVIHSIAL